MRLLASSAYLSFLCLLQTCAASEDYFVRSTEYNNGDYGKYVTQSFVSADSVVAVKPNVMKSFSACDDGSKLFVAPRGSAASARAMIFDANGDFIWSPQHGFGNIYNFQVQQYKGEPYLTFWAGNDAVNGHGAGHYYMYNKHYEHFKRIRAANHLDADLHAFTITADDTALASVYETVAADLSEVDSKRSQGYIWDCLFQEIDIETGEAVFQWRASEHVSLTESYVRPNAASERDAWDFFHINMIEKDDLGNYLVSSRHLRSIMYIEGKTGNILWHLGGKKNSFKDLSNGDATTFVGQHDAHWADGHSAITFFDNRADWQDTIEQHSKGTRVAVDLEKMTAKLEATYSNPFARILSISQGSYQTLPNGNVLIGYGYNTVMTEFAANGTLLCDMWFSPQTRFGSGDVQSYRDLKFNWTGYPRYPPNVVVRDNKLYVSWLGATEVKQWVLQDAVSKEDEFDIVLSFAKDGFETTFTLEPNQPIRQYVQVTALDREGIELGTSLIVDLGDKTTTLESDMKDSGNDTTLFDSDMPSEAAEDYETDTEELESEVQDLQLLLGFGILAVLSGLLVVWLSLGSKVFRLHGWRAVSQYDHRDSASANKSGLLARMKEHWRYLLRRRSSRAETDGEDPEDSEILLSRNELAELEHSDVRSSLEYLRN